MNILFTIALNNKTTAQNYKTVYFVFKTLADTLERLGHNVFILSHPDCYRPVENYNSFHVTETLTDDNFQDILKKIGFIPDFAFIWNGNLPADKKTIKVLKNNSIDIVYGELGFFDHYNKTCYFDLNGVNCRISEMAGKLVTDIDSDLLYNAKLKYSKTRLIEDNYVFVPLQVETDTQIVEYSPFKKMEDFLEYVESIVPKDVKIVVKCHPKAEPLILPNRFITVTEDVHHYIPYADLVIGINSTVMVETLLYHGNVLTCGLGIASRNLTNEARQTVVTSLLRKQMTWEEIADDNYIMNSKIYKQMMDKVKTCKD